MKFSIEERTLRFGVDIFKMCQLIQKSENEFNITKQLIRSSSSIGANTFEARYAISKSDFVFKQSISLKETFESMYWLRFMKDASLISIEEFNAYHDEADQLRKIISSIIQNTKKKMP